MAYQLFAKGKTITPVTSSLITSTGQFTDNGNSNVALSSLSLTGFTATSSSVNKIPVWLNVNNLVVGQEYSWSFKLLSASTSTVTYNINPQGVSNPYLQTPVINMAVGTTYTGSFIATETTAQIGFRYNFNRISTSNYTISNFSFIGDTIGFNGITELDIQSGSPFTLDFNFKDIKDLKSKGSHSYNFRLPSTPNNDTFFGHYFKVGSYYSSDNFSFNPFGSASCYVLKNTLEVFKGNLQLTNVYLKDKNRYEYECILYSDEVTFLDLIKGIKFKDLDFTELNHQLTRTNVYESYNSNSLDGGNLVYSLWDYGIGHASNEYPNYFQQPVGNDFFSWQSFSFVISKLRPQVKIKALINKVFALTGYTYKSNFISSDATFQKVFMDLNNNKSESITTTIPASAFNSQVTNTSQNIINSNGYVPTRVVQFPTEVSDQSAQWNNTSHYWTPAVDGWYKVTISGIITPSTTPTVTTNNVLFNIWKNWNGTDIIPEPEIVGYFPVLSVGSATTFSVDLTEYFQSSTNIFDRMYIDLMPLISSNDSVTWQLTDMVLNIEAIEIQEEDTNVVFINNLFGDLTIESWWKSILLSFNLVVVPNKDDPTELIIEPYDDFVDTGDTYDWSEKVDYKKDVKIIPPSTYCGKRVVFKHTESEDYVYQNLGSTFDQQSSNYGDYIEAGVRNQFAEKDKEFKSIFCPTINYPLNSSVFDLGVYTCAIWAFNQDGVKKNTGGIRLSFFHGVKPLPNNLNYALSNSNNFGGNSHNNYPFFSAYSKKDFTDGSDVWSVNWQDNLSYPPQSWDALPSFGLARKYWRNYVLDNFNVNSRMLSLNIRLNSKDIYDFSFADTIKLMGQNYRVNSIKGFPVSSDGNSKVELLLVNKSNFIPTTAISQDGGVIVGDNVIECDFTFHSVAQFTGMLQFTTSTNATPTPSDITQECCVGLGYQWKEVPNSVNGFYCFMPEWDNPSDNQTELRTGAGNFTDNGTNILNGQSNTSRGASNNIIGAQNTIRFNSFDNRIEGNENEILNDVQSTFIYGNNNKVTTFTKNTIIFDEFVRYINKIKGGRLSGVYGQLLINGDDILAKGNINIPIGSIQKGNFVVSGNQGSSDSTFYLGHNGEFTLSSGYNSIAGLNAIRFPFKSNIRLSLEIVGIIQEDTNNIYKDKAIINKTILISNYQNPIIIYENTDSSTIDTNFGTVTHEVFTLTKPPYTGGGIALKLTSNGRKEIEWTASFKYETTTLKNLASATIQNPTAITGCVLWLDASNEGSLTLSGSDVTEWKDISGGNNHVLQASATYKPEWKIDDWHRPHLEFDGVTANLNNEDADLVGLAGSNNTFIAVYKSDVTTAEYYGQVIMGCIQPTYTPRVGLRINANGSSGAGGSDSIAYSSQSSSSSVNACNIPSAGVDNLSIAVGTRDGVNVKVYDGNGNTDTGTTGANNASVTDFCVGGSSTSGTTDIYEFNGKIYELICYNVALSDTQVNQVITYLKNKWNIV
ncbi:MAG: hypothetical protein Unbinned6486contig1001_8 [Prokaryotic dsDNA virus sp.]|nr:MAG: hypothetical protein Unbinned6486contig1001_8 [Prokaryotic dsDNA virus sp.]|tara:strand:+ start:20228 stop:24676 length:4449 start_codon:yes stop_codon:yes gene_type:complete